MSLTILVLDDEKPARDGLKVILSKHNYEVKDAADLESGRAILEQGTVDVVLLDEMLPDGLGTSLLEESFPNRPLMIVITGHGAIEMAVRAMKNGAHDFLQKPVDMKQLEKALERAGEIIAMRRELQHLRDHQYGDFVLGSSHAMKEVMQQAERGAQVGASILIQGETGVGKEVVAKYIHESGPRRDKPFMAINCASFQSTMIESELFGHEAGAYTGADKKKIGLMEQANNGVLFLDEISSMAPDMQAKLLRALEDRSFRRMGGNVLIKVDVQLVSASNRNLPEMIAEGKFREDLLYRLNVLQLNVPPLRERKQDIPELVGFFVRHFNASMGLNVQDVTQQAMEQLIAYDWPGNIRELRNVLERAMLFCDDPAIGIQHLPAELATPAAKKKK
ncbi:MAG TPA: sigma-54 dependent transcriptional regulator [Anaerolineales bacterium]|nr:sigma-54 dependent transcriptional regulator [Anaerolineales bacterium]HRQ93089.1 sigma-54 dependent transcriptional regulator [Anaerolineales bacterium]